jgi:hypothetical protein
MPKLKTLTTPYADEDVKQWEFPFIAGDNAKWYNHCRRVW